MFFFVTFSFFLILIMSSVGNNKPENYKRGAVRTIFAWLLMILAIACFVKDIMLAVSVGSFETCFNMIYFPSLIFMWSLYLFNCGPMYSAIWKRIVKTILYIVLSILFAFISYLPFDVLLDEPMVLIAPSIIFFIVWGIILILNNTPKKQENQA